MTKKIDVKACLMVLALCFCTITAEVVEITSVEDFNRRIAQKNQLMVFDLYADWCGPCRLLEPILVEVSKEQVVRAQFYKIDTEALPAIAQAFQVSGIPYVVFFKDGKIVGSLTGLQAKDAYTRAVEIFSSSLKTTADGTVRNGIREISLVDTGFVGNVFVLRGEKTTLTFQNPQGEWRLDLAGKDIKSLPLKDKSARLTFVAKKAGSYPLYQKVGNRETRQGWVVVLEQQKE